MRVAAIMTEDVVACGPSDTLERAAFLMWDRDVGCLPVIDDVGELVGILTDRDVALAAYRRGDPLRDIPVSLAMAPRVYSCRPDDDIRDATRIMAMRRVRRLPVVDDQGRVVGIVSLDDLAQSAARTHDVELASVGATLAEVIGLEHDAEG